MTGGREGGFEVGSGDDGRAKKVIQPAISMLWYTMQICETTAWTSGLKLFLTDGYPAAACQVPEELLRLFPPADCLPKP